ncbi:hypothetical protein [Neobacillus sp. DY30]|uniref:hypothetical protein n=1 Tax=Neobacillus sp. DY30 TaxID=3047871 RepID=UPI0024C0AA16|nr:hypothetical protein [Neobacillus sp. DY30]WHY02626.1 hypothetical protein QNH29_10550 [Neobacillus sp. DY30]
MVLSIIVYIAWLGIAVFYAMKKPFSKIEISAIILFVFIIDINRSWITNDELKYITYSEVPLKYIAYIIDRTFITPLFIAIGINSIPRNSTLLKKTTAILISSFVLILIRIVLLSFNVVHYHQWNLIYDYLYFVLLYLLGYFILYCYNSFVLKELK